MKIGPEANVTKEIWSSQRKPDCDNMTVISDTMSFFLT